jgi:hypothetical protein
VNRTVSPQHCTAMSSGFFKCGQKYNNVVAILGSSVLFLLLFFTPNILLSFGQTQPERPNDKSLGANSFSEISRELSPSPTGKIELADSSYIIQQPSFGKLLPQQFSQAPADSYTGSDSFSEHSRDGIILDEDEELLPPLLP